MNKDDMKTNNASRQVHAGTFLENIFKTLNAECWNAGTLEIWDRRVSEHLQLIVVFMTMRSHAD